MSEEYEVLTPEEEELLREGLAAADRGEVVPADEVLMDNAEKLARLYNRARPQGLGFLHYDPKMMAVEEAQAILDQRKGDMYFDYLKGRVMKIHLQRMDAFLYERDNGQDSVLDALTGPYLPCRGEKGE